MLRFQNILLFSDYNNNVFDCNNALKTVSNDRLYTNQFHSKLSEKDGGKIGDTIMVSIHLHEHQFTKTGTSKD